ncbi:MAG: hypothetical protein NTW87_02610 [Planctomycetota bacterium]|nr:hypothetical protein [Planctomycetota bacterium]
MSMLGPALAPCANPQSAIRNRYSSPPDHGAYTDGPRTGLLQLARTWVHGQAQGFKRFSAEYGFFNRADQNGRGDLTPHHADAKDARVHRDEAPVGQLHAVLDPR